MKAHVFATRIGGILTDNKFDRYVGGKTRGALDFSSLSKIAYSSKIFKQREARKNKDYKVLVVADASGSMCRGDRAGNTERSLEMLNEALSHTDVEYALWSFAGDILCLKDFTEKKKKAGDVGKLYHSHIHNRYLLQCDDCNIRWGSFERCEKCPSCGEENDDVDSTSSYNADGLALHLALENIKDLSGEHIIIMLSDGEADCIPYGPTARYMQKDGLRYETTAIRDVARKVIATPRTILCSIGIESSEVRRHYPKENTIVVENSDEVGDALLTLIGKHIKRG